MTHPLRAFLLVSLAACTSHDEPKNTQTQDTDVPPSHGFFDSLPDDQRAFAECCSEAFEAGVHDGLQCNAPDVPPAGPYGDDLKDAICPEWVPTCYQRGHLEGCTAARDCSCP